MATFTAKAYSASRLDKIARQIERIESHESEWEAEAERVVSRSQLGGEETRRARGVRGTADPRSRTTGEKSALWWESGPILDRLNRWGDPIARLCQEMVQQTKRPFSIRTQQISVLCAFVPFVLSIMIASIQFMPNLPAMPLWSKFTWFLGIPIVLAVAGSLVGFVVGVMLDTLERQADNAAASRPSPQSEPAELITAPVGAKSSVWVAVEDLQPNQRVSETVVGPDGTPILLRHTLLKPSHIEMLKAQNVAKVQIEVMTYPSGGELAVAG